MPLFKVWSTTHKKCVIAMTIKDLIASGRKKLLLKEGPVSVYLEDGTEIDEDEILQELPPGSIMYLLNNDDEKPWERKLVNFHENLTCNKLLSSEPICESLEENRSCTEAETSSLAANSLEGRLLRPWLKLFIIPQKNFSEELLGALDTGVMS